jgi:galactose mutarotase-like enzyme
MPSQYVTVVTPKAPVGQRVYLVAPPLPSPFGIKRVLVSERGLNPLSIQVLLPPTTTQEILLTTPGLTRLSQAPILYPEDFEEEATAAVQHLRADPRRQYEMADALMAPFCNRVWDSSGGNKVTVHWEDRKPVEIAANFGPGLAGHGLVYDLKYDQVEPVEENGFYGLRGTGTIKGWFEPLEITHWVGIRNGEFFRSVSLRNVSDTLREVIAGIGSHPYFLIPDDVKRAEVTVEIPARFVVLTEDSARPMFPTGYQAVTESKLAQLFSGEMAQNKLGSISLDHCFFGLTPEALGSGSSDLKVNARIFFPGNYGLEISAGLIKAGKYKPVNAVVVYSPADTSAHMRGAGLEGKRNFLCFEMQTPLLGAMEFDQWAKLLPEDLWRTFYFHTPTGMRRISCGRELEWEVSYRLIGHQ